MLREINQQNYLILYWFIKYWTIPRYTMKYNATMLPHTVPWNMMSICSLRCKLHSWQDTNVRLQFTLLQEHDNHNSGCPPDSPIWQEIKVISRCSAWCQPSACVHTNRCGARMTDNLSTKSFYLTHLRALTTFLLSEAGLMIHCKLQTLHSYFTVCL